MRDNPVAQAPFTQHRSLAVCTAGPKEARNATLVSAELGEIREQIASLDFRLWH
jgi:hypothetical protein